MRQIWVGISLVMISLACQMAAASGLCDWPVPEAQIGVDAKTGITKAQFNKVMDLVELKYAPVFLEAGCKFVLHRSWTDGTVNAQAWAEMGSNGPECHVEMFGGLARYPGITPDTMAEVAAHEIGHHLGGEPWYSGETLSVEGQADYFATDIAMYLMGIDSSAPSQRLSDVLGELNGEPKTSLPGPKLPKVKKTMEGHPPAQCRRVTMEAGRLHAERPSCWFKK
jgi:hypothetical protein